MTGEELVNKFQEQGQIIVSFKTKELRKEKKVFDFLPAIKVHSRAEEKILYTWAAFFTQKGVPFLVVSNGKKKTLWKGLVVSEEDSRRASWESWKKKNPYSPVEEEM